MQKINTETLKYIRHNLTPTEKESLLLSNHIYFYFGNSGKYGEAYIMEW